MDTSKHKSVGIDIDTYNKLRRLCEDNHRNIRQQIAKLVNDDYKKEYSTTVTKTGIESIQRQINNFQN